MKLGDLLDLLKNYDSSCDVFVGKFVEFGGGDGAVIENDKLFVSKVSNAVILHTNNPKKPLDHGNEPYTITNFN